MLTDTELDRRLQAARDAEKKARARLARLKREHAGSRRKLETQRKCCLGGALLALVERGGESDQRLAEYVRRFLIENPPHESNAAALVGTPFALPMPLADGGNEH